MSDSKLADPRFHECFQLKVEKVKFEHVSRYADWKQGTAEVAPVLSDFNTTVSVIRKRDQHEMKTEEARRQLKLCGTPTTEVRANFDTDVLL